MSERKLADALQELYDDGVKAKMKDFIIANIDTIVEQLADKYLAKNAKAASATTADSATKATQDGNGNVISSTYLTQTNAATTYLTKSDAENTYLKKNDSASYADYAVNADYATNADYANEAKYADKADYANEAKYADKADKADEADFATKAERDSANHIFDEYYFVKSDNKCKLDLVSNGNGTNVALIRTSSANNAQWGFSLMDSTGGMISGPGSYVAGGALAGPSFYYSYGTFKIMYNTRMYIEFNPTDQKINLVAANGIYANGTKIGS